MSVEIDRRGDSVRVVVEDDGVGIPATARQKVMEPFVSLASETAGSGLGLSIVADIARQHHGQLTATTGPGGKGTRFELALECDRAA